MISSAVSAALFADQDLQGRGKAGKICHYVLLFDRAVLDAHSHSIIPCRIIMNQDEKEVPLSSTGTKLAYIGQLTITPSGTITTGLIAYPEKDEETTAYIQDFQTDFAEDMNRVVRQSQIPLSISSETGIRMVRSRETAIGDFCANAYRVVSDAEIAFVNGGGIRADLPKGNITCCNGPAKRRQLFTA